MRTSLSSELCGRFSANLFRSPFTTQGQGLGVKVYGGQSFRGCDPGLGLIDPAVYASGFKSKRPKGLRVHFFLLSPADKRIFCRLTGRHLNSQLGEAAQPPVVTDGCVHVRLRENLEENKINKRMEKFQNVEGPKNRGDGDSFSFSQLTTFL